MHPFIVSCAETILILTMNIKFDHHCVAFRYIFITRIYCILVPKHCLQQLYIGKITSDQGDINAAYFYANVQYMSELIDKFQSAFLKCLGRVANGDMNDMSWTCQM